MNKQVKTFTSTEFGSIRVLNGEDGEPWFVASDISKILEYRDAAQLTRLLDDDEKGTQILRTLGGDQKMRVINESGFYRAIMQRRSSWVKDDHKRRFIVSFQRWVTHEVLPSIRKHGGYMAGQEQMTPEQMVLASMRWLESRVKEQAETISRQAGQNRNVPLQRWVEQGLFRIKETAVTHPDGHVTINRTPKVTGKGQTYFLKKYAPNCLDITVTTLEVGA